MASTCVTLECCSARHRHAGCAVPLFCRRHPRDASCVWQGPFSRTTPFLQRRTFLAESMATMSSSHTAAAERRPLPVSLDDAWRPNATASPGGCGARKVFVDLGANDGQSLRWFARRHLQHAGSSNSGGGSTSSAPFTSVVLFEMNPAFEAALLAELASLPSAISR